MIGADFRVGFESESFIVMRGEIDGQESKLT
jgi:hypothetical protein